MPDFPPIGEYLADNISIWASCGAERPCDHHAKLDLAAIIAEHGNMPLGPVEGSAQVPLRRAIRGQAPEAQPLNAQDTELVVGHTSSGGEERPWWGNVSQRSAPLPRWTRR